MKPAGLALALLLAPLAAADPKCFSPSREGHCIVVEVNGQTSAKLSKKTKKLLKELGGLSYHGDDTRYELATPIRGALELRAAWTSGSDSFFGGPGEIDAHVIPLEDVTLDTHGERTSDPSVQVGGAAVSKDERVLNENRLPPGKYLMTVKLSGRSNWDRQLLFFEVAKD